MKGRKCISRITETLMPSILSSSRYPHRSISSWEPRGTSKRTTLRDCARENRKYISWLWRAIRKCRLPATSCTARYEDSRLQGKSNDKINKNKKREIERDLDHGRKLPAIFFNNVRIHLSSLEISQN
ncbi:hypothetical protein PUN28_000110 [Cardiocondyla obscurior]|uniref:Uncharacterized protein n=1 Tax=Cardiocondyla obscurior TaxID=286306 RepID=A0AAW2GXS7_9HYME